MGHLGSVRMETQDGIKELPVYELSDVPSSRSAFRVSTPSGIGAIPSLPAYSVGYTKTKIKMPNEILNPMGYYTAYGVDDTAQVRLTNGRNTSSFPNNLLTFRGDGNTGLWWGIRQGGYVYAIDHAGNKFHVERFTMAGINGFDRNETFIPFEVDNDGNYYLVVADDVYESGGDWYMTNGYLQKRNPDLGNDTSTVVWQEYIPEYGGTQYMPYDMKLDSYGNSVLAIPDAPSFQLIDDTGTFQWDYTGYTCDRITVGGHDGYANGNDYYFATQVDSDTVKRIYREAPGDGTPGAFDYSPQTIDTVHDISAHPGLNLLLYSGIGGIYNETYVEIWDLDAGQWILNKSIDNNQETTMVTWDPLGNFVVLTDEYIKTFDTSGNEIWSAAISVTDELLREVAPSLGLFPQFNALWPQTY